METPLERERTVENFPHYPLYFRAINLLEIRTERCPPSRWRADNKESAFMSLIKLLFHFFGQLDPNPWASSSSSSNRILGLGVWTKEKGRELSLLFGSLVEVAGLPSDQDQIKVPYGLMYLCLLHNFIIPRDRQTDRGEWKRV